MTLRAHVLPILVATFFLAPWAHGAPGSLDGSFGNNGKVTTVLGAAGKDYGYSTAAQTDGKIIVAGFSAPNATDTDFGVVRYNSDGSLDAGFGTGGIVTIGSPGSTYYCSAVTVQSDGKIILAGTIDFAVAVVRLSSDGTLDTSFNGTGFGATGPGGQVVSVIVQTDGKIVAAGNSSSQDFQVVRYNADGSLDTGFNTGGSVTTDFGDSEQVNSVALQADDKIVVVGSSSNFVADTSAIAIARYNPDGTLDTGFNSTGKLLASPGGTKNYGYGVAVQADGKLVVVATAYTPTNHAGIAVVRFNTDGTTDTGFSPGGLLIGNDSYGQAVALQADGKIVIGGAADLGHTGFDFAVVRYTTDGNLDPGFGTAGKTTVSFGSTNDYGQSLKLQSDGKIVLAGFSAASDSSAKFAVIRLIGGEPPPPLDPPVYDTTTTRTDGAQFLGFGAPTVDGGVVGGAAAVSVGGKKQTFIYGGLDGAALAQTGGPDGSGATFTELGDPIFAGEGIGFAGTALLPPPPSIPRLLRMDLGDRLFAVKPGGRVAALYSQLTKASGLHRLAAQTDPAPGVSNGQFAKFNSFGLPRNRVGLLYAALLHRGGAVTPANDFGIWRERADGTGTDLLLRTGRGGSLAREVQPTFQKLTFMPPVSNATDQRLSVAPDGGLGALAKLDDGSSAVVIVGADGTQSVPVRMTSGVPDEAGAAEANVVFEGFAAPATASGGRYALLAALGAAQRGLPPPPRQAIFASTGAGLQRVMARGDAVPGDANARWGQLGQPLMGEKGMIGLIAALTGKGVPPATRQALVRIEGGVKTIVARLGQPAAGMDDGVVYRKFMSVVVTDTDPARMVFTGLVRGPGVNGSNSVALWSYSAAKGVSLLMRSGGPIKAGGNILTVRTFEALQAPKKSMGQGRSTDASGFVTAKAKLSDGRVGVLRIPLP